jgi:Fe2+ transport system protein B
MLKEKRDRQELVKELQLRSEEDDNEEAIMKDRKVMFKNRKKPIFKDYNKIIAQSSTTPCRILTKNIIGLCAFLFVFFGTFIINGGAGVIRSYYFNPITLQVPYNYGTSLIYMTILTTDGQQI